MFNDLDGMWVAAFYDFEREEFVVGRDHLGIIPCYVGISTEDEIYFANELKTIHDQCVHVSILLPGSYIHNNME